MGRKIEDKRNRHALKLHWPDGLFHQAGCLELAARMLSACRVHPGLELCRLLQPLLLRTSR